MFQSMLVRCALLAAVVLVVTCPISGAAQPDLFANYYVGGNGPGGGQPAQMYLSPRPTPPLVGHTYITYQPLNPHEFLYHHKRNYYTYYPQGGATITKVRWW